MKFSDLTKNNLQKFIFRKSFIYIIFFSTINLFFFKNKFLITIGLILGSIVSIFRLGILSMTIAKFITMSTKLATIISIFTYFFNLLILIILLTLSAKLNSIFFIGIVEGIFLVPIILFVNSITEILGISKNNFQ